MHLEDTEILSLINSNEAFNKGFEALVDKYQEPLYWHIRRMVNIHSDADDVVQNTFIKVFKSISKFRHESKLFTWLYRIATNEALTFIKNRNKKSTEQFDTNLALRDDPYFSGDEIQLLLKQAIETLPTKQKQVFILRYYDELKYKDMAQILKSSEGSLKASYHHAVKKIELFLKANILNAN